MEWDDNLYTFGLTFTDGSSCKIGTLDFTKSHTFDPEKQISRIEVIIHEDEKWILRINFYSGEELLVEVGDDADDFKGEGGRIEEFEIAADEQLIGAELDHGEWDGDDDDEDYFYGVTWLKWKTTV